MCVDNGLILLLFERRMQIIERVGRVAELNCKLVRYVNQQRL